ncbi:MAG: YvcK family protein [Candidatus Omnitrophica bacterium]|nr:YvcK family protein [Candidatus Omnitrophota bacterium]
MVNRFRRIFLWLYPGIGIKRWVGLIAFGVVLLILGSGGFPSSDFVVVKVLDSIILVSGLVILVLGIKRLLGSLINAFVPSNRSSDLVDLLYQRKQLSRGPKIVTVGGGTGLAMLLSGLKEFSSNITAIVTVADDGGSSGRIRKQFDILPPGDIRNCLVALADASTMMRDLFQFRFEEGSELAGHSFGNLFITVMTRLTGDFEKAVRETSKVLALRGQVVPSTLEKVVLAAKYKDGSVTEGEYNIPRQQKSIARVYLKPGAASASTEAVRAIREADVIVLGPGSLYTSIIPNLLIREISDAIVSSRAIKAYVCNVMTQPGETDGYSAAAHVKQLVEHSHPRILDYCIVNTAKIPPEILARYEGEHAYPVAYDRRAIQALGYHVIEDDTVSTEGQMARHDTLKLAKIILSLLDEF